MTRKTDDCDTKYRVTFIVDVSNPERLLKKAREMEAHLTAIVNEIGASARRARGEDDHEPEGVATIEEALCWVLPNGDDDPPCIDILDAKAEAIGEAS
jgi:hypothetical protein